MTDISLTITGRLTITYHGPDHNATLTCQVLSRGVFSPGTDGRMPDFRVAAVELTGFGPLPQVVPLLSLPSELLSPIWADGVVEGCRRVGLTNQGKDDVAC